MNRMPHVHANKIVGHHGNVSGSAPLATAPGSMSDIKWGQNHHTNVPPSKATKPIKSIPTIPVINPATILSILFYFLVITSLCAVHPMGGTCSKVFDLTFFQIACLYMHCHDRHTPIVRGHCDLTLQFLF